MNDFKTRLSLLKKAYKAKQLGPVQLHRFFYDGSSPIVVSPLVSEYPQADRLLMVGFLKRVSGQTNDNVVYLNIHNPVFESNEPTLTVPLGSDWQGPYSFTEAVAANNCQFHFIGATLHIPGYNSVSEAQPEE